MWAGLDRFDRILLDATLATTILLSFVILLVLLCRQPSRRLVVVQAATVLTIFILPLVATNPFSPSRVGLRLLVPGRRSQPIRPSLRPSEAVHASAGDGEGSGRVLRAVLPGRAGNAPSWSLWMARACGLAYLAGVAAGMGWTALGFWGIRRLIHDSSAPRPETSAFFHSLIPLQGENLPAPELRVATRLRRPILAGLFRPCILIPADYDQAGFDRESLRLIFLHELAHAGQSDTYSSAAASLAQCLWFFHPFVWWLRAQLRVDQEFLADERVVHHTGSPSGYATRLVSLAAGSEAGAPSAPSGNQAGSRAMSPLRDASPSPLMQRVVMLLHCPFPVESKAPRWWTLSAPFGVVGLAILSIGTSTALLKTSSLASRPSRSELESGVFQVGQFIAPPWKRKSTGRSVPYVLPLALPPRFELTVKIEGSPSALSRMYLAGLSLEPPLSLSLESGPPPTPEDAAAGWHLVKVARQSDQIAITVDTRTWHMEATRERLSEWLSIEPPPAETVVLRDLQVIW